MNTLEEHEKVFAERKRRAQAEHAMTCMHASAKPIDQPDFVQRVECFLCPDEDTYQARARIKARVEELKALITIDSPLELTREYLDLREIAEQPGKSWKAAKERHRPIKEEAIPSAPWGNEDNLEKRKKEVREERQRNRKNAS